MYRIARKTDLEDILKIPELTFSKEELEKYLDNRAKYVYVYENDENNIIGATFFGSDEIDDDDYDSEIYGIYTKDIESKNDVCSEILFQTKIELFEKGYRSLIVWVDEDNTSTRKMLESAGGMECKTRQRNDKIQIAYSYALTDYLETEK